MHAANHDRSIPRAAAQDVQRSCAQQTAVWARNLPESQWAVVAGMLSKLGGDLQLGPAVLWVHPHQLCG
jgi:hypothetical protein